MANVSWGKPVFNIQRRFHKEELKYTIIMKGRHQDYGSGNWHSDLLAMDFIFENNKNTDKNKNKNKKNPHLSFQMEEDLRSKIKQHQQKPSLINMQSNKGKKTKQLNWSLTLKNQFLFLLNLLSTDK